MCLSNSRRVCTTSSAAAEGVEARTSATKSAMVKSVSWPTPEMTGISEAKIARATISSLKDHKSSMEPPPRARMRTSTSFALLKNFSALTISSGAPSPCTRTGKTIRWTFGTRRVRLGAIVFQSEVDVAGLGGAAVGDFSLHADVGEIPGEQIANFSGQLTDSKGVARGHGLKVSCWVMRRDPVKTK